MRMNLTIDSGNASVTEDGKEYQVADLLREAAVQVKEGQTSGTLRDYNGHAIGDWSITW